MADKNIQITQRNADNTAWDNIYPKTKASNVIADDGTDLEVQLAQIPKFQTAQGTANSITLTGIPLADGYSKTFVVANDNGGSATTVNGKNLYKPNTTTPPNLIKGKAVTIWYDLAKTCFFIKASAEGNTIAAHVLASDTFSNDNDTGLIGTMPNKGAITQDLAINGSYTIPAGYHNGLGVVNQSITTKTAATFNPSTTAQTIAASQYLNGVQTIAATTGSANMEQVLAGYTFNSGNGIGLTGNIPSKVAATITPSTANQIISAGQYIAGIQTVLGDANLISANIKSGANIFGVAGTATPSSMGELSLTASGTINGGAVGTSTMITMPSANIGQAKYWTGTITINFTNGTSSWNFYGSYNPNSASNYYYLCSYYKISSSSSWQGTLYMNPILFYTYTVSATSYTVQYYAYS